MLLFINPANQHDKDILEEKHKEIVKEFENCVIIGDKAISIKDYKIYLNSEAFISFL